MKVTQYVAPTSNPVSLSDLKLHLKIDSGSMSDGFTESQSIAPGLYAATAGFTLFGAAVAVYGEPARVSVNAGACGSGGTVDVKIQESPTGTGGWVDWTGGAFTAITTANDNAIFEKEYTGSLDYIRTAGQVTGAGCEFGTSVTQYESTSDEDTLLSIHLTGAIEKIQELSRHQLGIATFDYYPPAWPDGDGIKLPFGNLVSVTHVKYTDSAGAETTLAVTTGYTVELNGEQCGRIVLPYQGSWPTATLSPSNPIAIRFVCGYTTIKEGFKAAILLWAQATYERRGITKEFVENILAILPDKLYDEF